jgi:hypothetical protein
MILPFLAPNPIKLAVLFKYDIIGIGLSKNPSSLMIFE